MANDIPVAGIACPICGLDSPHSHSSETVERERYCRPAFEKYFESQLVSNPNGLDPSGTFGWALSWNTRSKTGGDYHYPQVEVSWAIWQNAWRERGDMFPELGAACRSAAGVPIAADAAQEGEANGG